MPKPSALVLRIQAQERLRYEMRLAQEVDDAMQIAKDAAFLAAADVLHMGPGRCEAFGAALTGYVNEMAALRARDKQADPEYVYTREKVDARLRKICGDKFEPWEVRYGETHQPL